MRVLALLLCLTAAAWATVYTTAASGDWLGDSTWGGGGHPVAGDTAVFNGAFNVTADSTVIACAVCSAATYTGTFALGTYRLNVSGNFTWKDDGDTAFMTIGTSTDSGLVVLGDITIGTRGKITCGASKVYAGGSWIAADGTFSYGTSTVSFIATTGGKTINKGRFYNVTFNGVGGEWSLTTNHTEVYQNILFTNGTLNLNTRNFYCQTANSQTITMGAFTLNIGASPSSFISNTQKSLVVGTGATVTVSTGAMTLGALTINGTGTFACSDAASISTYNNIVITSANWTPGTSTLTQRYYDAHTITCNQPLYNYTASAGGGTTTLANDLLVQNNCTISGALALSTFSLFVGGNFAKTGTFTANTGTVTFIDLTKTSTISGSSTFNVLGCTTSGKTVKFTNGTTQTVGSFTSTGESGSRVMLTNDTGTNTWAISDATGTNTASYTNISYSAASGGALFNALASDSCTVTNSTGWTTGISAENPLLLIGD